VEKLIYLVWLEPETTRAEVEATMLGAPAEQLLALGPHRLSMDLRDSLSDIPAPMPTPEGETPLHAVVSVWLDAVDHSAPYEEVLRGVATRLAGYQVVESLYGDYGRNRWSIPRDWPDGQRSTGVLTVALFEQHPDLTHHRVDPAPLPLCPQCRLPGGDRRGTTAPGHCGGSVALPRIGDRPHAVLLRGGRPGEDDGQPDPDDRGDHCLH
jgi:hypothetical protein